ncbi:MAG: plastocyanin/azurin family copper-binding protein [Chryseolinea sp.]
MQLLLAAAASFTFNSVHAQSGRPQTEEDYYYIKSIPIPEEVKLEVGGIAVLNDGSIAVSTRRGEIWSIENAYMTSGQPRFSRFASGMHETLGLAYYNGAFYTTQRGELTKVIDSDHDGRADRYESVYRFDISGNYHEYAYGPLFDRDGNMYVTLNVAWIGYGESLGKWHGWLLKISQDGKMEPIAAGLRSPAGFAINSSGDIFYAENQGDWVGSGRVTHLEKGDFAGNAGSLNWTGEPESPLKLTKKQLATVDNGAPMHEAAKTIKELKLPAVWFPQTLMGISTSDILEDTTHGAFGPFEGQYFVADQGHSKIMRMTLEKVKGKYQGACFPFREGFASGLLRLRWGIDGSIFAGMTSRGWASTGRADYALQRLVWSGKTPFEMHNITAKPDGFVITFTKPVDRALAKNPMNYSVSGFTYHYHHQYGSEIIQQEACNLKGIVVADDNLSVRLVVDNLREGFIHEVKLNGIAAGDGSNLIHNTGYYTLNQLPEGSPLTLTEEQKVVAHHHEMPAAATATTATATATKKPAVAKTSKRQLTMPKDWKQPDQVISLGTKPGLKFDVASLQMKAGSKIKLIFNNNDDMTHNVVFVAPGSAKEVGDAAFNMGLNGAQLSYIPSSVKVLNHTNLLQPGASETIYFIAPDKPGDYTLLCTYPGHAMIMQVPVKVVK